MIYIEPAELWEKFQTNKTSLIGHYLTCAEDDTMSIFMTADENNELTLMATEFDTGNEYVESFDTETIAVAAYEEMLTWLAEDDTLDPEPTEDDAEDFMQPILAATYAFTGVLTDLPPDKLGLTRDDLEELAYQMAWFLKGRFDIDSQLA